MNPTSTHPIKQCVVSLIIAVCTLYALTAYSQTITENDRGSYNNLFYLFWKDSGNAAMTLHDDGRFVLEWNTTTNNMIGGLGWSPGGPRVVQYAGEYNPDPEGISNLSIWGTMMTDPVIEFYIVESWVGHNPGEVAPREYFGAYETDGAVYDFYQYRRSQDMSIGSPVLNTYYSIRRETKAPGAIEGTITTGNHFDAWSAMGAEMGAFDFMILATEGYQSAGSSDITVIEGEPASCGILDGMPVCCSATADPDGDGYGEQHDDEVCVVTEDTVGWHPPNSDDILAAINAGGYGEAIAIDDVWYAPSKFISGGITRVSTAEIVGGNDNAVHQSVMTGDFSIAIPVMETQWVSVEFSLLELTFDSPGQRRFDVVIEGETVYSGLDIYAQSGRRTIWQPEPVEVLVQDHMLDIEVRATEGFSEEYPYGGGSVSAVVVRVVDDNSSGPGPGQASGAAGAWFLAIMGCLLCMARGRAGAATSDVGGLCTIGVG